MKRNILCAVCGLLLLTACSDSDSNDWVESAMAESGYTRSDFSKAEIPVLLVSVSELPQWLRQEIDYWTEIGKVPPGYKIFQGKWKGETIYYTKNVVSSYIGFYRQDGKMLSIDNWSETTDWRCVYSATPLRTGMTGTLHYDPTENRDSYIENVEECYYIWGYLNDSNLSKLDGKQVTLSGFVDSDLTDIVEDCPANVRCYGIDATYLRALK